MMCSFPLVISPCSLFLIFNVLLCQVKAELCPYYSPCTDFHHRTTSTGKAPIDTGTESAIAQGGHWNGIAPELYDVRLHFKDKLSYSGSLMITFKMVQNTDQIQINHNASVSTIDYRSISIRSNCSKDAALVTSTDGCISSTQFDQSKETLTINLAKATLKSGSSYVLSISSFQGLSKRTNGKCPGLQASESESGPYFFALTTIFQMRHAREVFPCFDYPRLKAEFDLCLEYPGGMIAASNMPSTKRETTNDGRTSECFERSPKLSTYLFTFALMINYAVESVKSPSRDLTIEVLTPRSMNRFRWILDRTIPAVEYMERVSGLRFPLRRLGFVVAYPSTFWGMENFGLVLLDGVKMQEHTNAPLGILYHEIAHQWLGDLITVGQWREICLQEGLTAYFDKRMRVHFHSTSRFEAEFNQDAIEFKFLDQYESVYGAYNVTQDIANICYDRPAYFFFAIGMWDGFEAIDRLVAELMRTRAYGSTDLNHWDEALARVVRRNGSMLRGYLREWFTQPGPLLLLTHKLPNDSSCVQIHQRQLNQNPTRPRPVPIVIDSHDIDGRRTRSIPIILDQLNQTICGLDRGYFLVDPETHSLTIKGYTLENYINFYSQSNSASSGYNRRLVGDFCFLAFQSDILPLDAEPKEFLEANWTTLIKLARVTVNIHGDCGCCLNTKDTIKSDSWACREVWKSTCVRSRLIKAVGSSAGGGRKLSRFLPRIGTGAWMELLLIACVLRN